MDRRGNLAANGSPKRAGACQEFGDLSSRFGGSPSAHNNNHHANIPYCRASAKVSLFETASFLIPRSLCRSRAFVVVMLALDLASLGREDIR